MRESAAPGVELRGRDPLEQVVQPAAAGPEVRRSEPLAQVVQRGVAAVGQSQRREDLLFDLLLQAAFRTALQDLSQEQHAEIRVDRPFARRDLEFRAGDVLHVPGARLLAVEVLAEFAEQLRAAGEAARMGEQVPQRGGADRRSFEFRQAGRRGRVEVERARLEPAHDQRRRRDDLRQGSQVVDRRRCDGGRAFVVGVAARGVFEDDDAPAGREQNAARRDAVRDRRVQQVRGTSQALRVEAGGLGRCVAQDGRRIAGVGPTRWRRVRRGPWRLGGLRR